MPNPLAFSDFSGRQHVEPSIDSRYEVVEAARFAGGNVFTATLLGRFPSGTPDTLGEFSSLSEFLAAHDPERLNGVGAQLAGHLFAPGFARSKRGAPLLRTVRLGKAAGKIPTVATLDLDIAGPTTVMTLTSLDYGTHVNSLKALVSAGTVGGKKLQVGFKSNPAWTRTGDNLGPLFNLQYVDAANAATVTITAATPGSATSLATTLTVPAAGTGDLSLDLTAADFNTVGKLIRYINQQPGYSATPIDTDIDLETMPSADLDAVAAGNINNVDVSVEADIGAIVHWVNTELAYVGPIKGISAARAANQSTAPDNMNAWALFSGGTEPALAGAHLVTAVTDALSRIEADEVESGIIVLDATDEAVQEAVVDWIDAQHALGQPRKWRAVFGLSSGTTDAGAQVRAAGLDHTQIALFYQRVVSTADATVTLDPIMVAAMFAGMTSGMDPVNDVQSLVLTEQKIAAAGIATADKRKKRIRETLTSSGVNMLREKGGRVLFSLAVNTSSSEKRMHRMWAESVALDLLEKSLEDAIDSQKVAWATDEYIANIRRALEVTLDGWKKAGVITAGLDPNTGEALRAFIVESVTATAGVTTCVLRVSLAGENDHVRIDATVRRVALAG